MMEHKKKTLKTEHQCTYVYIRNFSNVLSIFGQFCCFTIFFRDSEVWLVRILLRCDTYGHFGYLEKIKYFLFQEKLLREKIVFLLEPWLRPSAFIYIFEFSTETHMYPAKSLGVMVRGVLEGFGMDTKYVFFFNILVDSYIYENA